MVQGAAEDLLHYSRGDLSGSHRVGGGRGWSDATEPKKWNSGRECRVKESTTVFICVSFVTTSAGVIIRRPDVSSLRMEKSVGSVVEH